MPRVISGTSAGGLIAAFVCTRTDEELRRLLVPELANLLTAFDEPFKMWFKRFWETGARFDAVDWARKVRRPLPTPYSSQLTTIYVVPILHQRIDDVQGSLPQNGQDPQRLRHPGGSSLVSSTIEHLSNTLTHATRPTK